ncbi:transcriptional corepressor LEUNIG-like isoform X2 [Tripterygium wilfordii]|uniref:transcriptional corepressor LEUNIG-like isoform X2 n=1 Tax=Tripterygium wilfordii TaxID=458696 RepID=UPI0018F7E6DF|nr:transcriptional corepressor LEUNIG-like isoform X2 [Tripterygium wilfordii]
MGSVDEFWDAEKMLDLYVHDYMVKKNMHKAAETFKEEADVGNHPVVIDSPEGFLNEWWSIFYDVYAHRQMEHQETKAQASAKTVQMTGTEQRSIHSIVSSEHKNKQRLGMLPLDADLYRTLGQQASSALAARIYEGEHCRHPTQNIDANLQLLDIHRFNVSKLMPTSSRHSNQQTSNENPHQSVRGAIFDFSFRRPISVDPNPYRLHDSSGPFEPGINNGVNPLPLSGRPVNQLQMLTAQHQYQLLARALTCTPGHPMLTRPEDRDITDGPTKSESSSKDRQIVRKRKTLSNLSTGEKVSKSTEDDKPLGDHVDSFCTREEDHVDSKDDPFSALNCSTTACDKNEPKSFTFKEVGCLHSSRSKVFCCHFSSNGKILASAGHEKKVRICNMETFNFIDTSEEHSHLITDVRFKPSSTIFATSSFDQTVQIWDAARTRKSLVKLLGHSEQVMSLDFHPRKLDLLCSCDSNDEIRLWNVNRGACIQVLKGATKQVRFQPLFGKMLGTAAGNNINVMDVETNNVRLQLKGHAKEVLSICWDTTGEYIASVSEDSARLWSLVSGGKCTRELCSNGNQFQSCTFHPRFPKLLIIGGYQILQLWYPTEGSKTWTIPAHDGLIASLADSMETGMVASASHDQCVKLWK